jgi:hypothetical protein
MDTAVSDNNSPELSTPFPRDTDVAVLADWAKAIAALADAYSRPITPAMMPSRLMARGDGFWLRGMCAVSPSGEYFGSKRIAASPKIRRASYLISLFDQRTMELAALVDGRHGCEEFQRVVPAFAEEEVDVGDVVLHQHTVAQVLPAGEGGVAQAQVIAAQAQQLGGDVLADVDLLVYGPLQRAVAGVGVGCEEQGGRVGHAGDEVVQAREG